MKPSTVLVMGSGDVGSAVAHRLFMLGANVILHDQPAPAHTRRGMSFTDSLFAGTGVLEGVLARHVRSIEAVQRAWSVVDEMLVCDLPLQVLTRELVLDALVDARMRKRATPEDHRSLAAIVVGLGPGFTVGENCTLAIETAWGDELGHVVPAGATKALAGEPRQLGGSGRERFVYAIADGRWATRHGIGALVAAGEPVGELDSRPIYAPMPGTIRGLSHDGVRVTHGQKILEIDPREGSNAFGLGERPRAIARGVSTALDLDPAAGALFFGFETGMERSLGCMPMSVRMKLDLCGLKVSLDQWRALPFSVRQTVLEASCGNPAEVKRVRSYLEKTAAEAAVGPLPEIACDPDEWRGLGQVVPQVAAATRELGLALRIESWASLSDLRRFALIKLSRQGHTRNLPSALVEFGLL